MAVFGYLRAVQIERNLTALRGIMTTRSRFLARVQDKSGMNLVELLVVSGVLAIVMMGMTTMMTNLQKAQKGVDLKAQSQSLGTTTRILLGSPDGCKKAFF